MKCPDWQLFKIYKDKTYAFKYGGMEQQDSVKEYFDIVMDEIKHKDGSDSIFVINGNVDQKLNLDDEWKVMTICATYL